MNRKQKLLFVKLRMAGHAVQTLENSSVYFVCPRCAGAWSEGVFVKECRPIADSLFSGSINASQIEAGTITADKIVAKEP